MRDRPQCHNEKNQGNFYFHKIKERMRVMANVPTAPNKLFGKSPFRSRKILN